MTLKTGKKAQRHWRLILLLLPLLMLSGCVGVDGRPLLLPSFAQNTADESASATNAAPAAEGMAEIDKAETEADATAAEPEGAASTAPDPSGVELAEEVQVEAGYYLFQPIAGSTVEVTGETVETRGPDALPNGFQPLELYLTGARITAESSPLNTMPLQTVFQVIMGDILMEGAKMGPPFEITLQDAPGMAADFTAPPPVAGQPDVAGRVLMIVDESHIFMMMGLGPMTEWDVSGSAQFQRILETVRFLN